MPYQTTVGHLTYRFADLKTLLAKASPARSGDYLAGLGTAAEHAHHRAGEHALRAGHRQSHLGLALRSSSC